MISKELLSEYKKTAPHNIPFLLKNQTDIRGINFILENLGALPKDFDGTFLLDLLKHNHAQVRLNAVKNIGKIKSELFTNLLIEAYYLEVDTIVKREIISSIGRQRNRSNKNFLTKVLQDQDPKVVGQAIRALLVFKRDKDVISCLEPMINHPNEMIRNIIYKEFYTKESNYSTLPHNETYEYLKNVVVNADVLDVLKHIPDESFHLTFTSPPYYNARDYSIYPSYQDYLEFLSAVFRETHRVTKEGRFLIINTSPIIIPRISRSHSSKRYGIPFDLHPYLVNNGWEFVDDIVWMKPEASVKNRIGGFMQHRKPLGYKPNAITEYLMVYRKQTDKLLDWNMRSYDWDTVQASRVADGYESTNVWKIDPCFDRVHSAIFPVELCKRVIQYYSFKGDIVFDPFGGSGTVGKTARNQDRLFFLTEKDEVYFEYMKSKASSQGLFPEKQTKFQNLQTFLTTIT